MNEAQGDAPQPNPCTCPKTWTDQQRQAFGELPIKFSDCPVHDL